MKGGVFLGKLDYYSLLCSMELEDTDVEGEAR
jgi:hypothetical protein